MPNKPFARRILEAVEKQPDGKYIFREKEDHLMSVEPLGITTTDLKALKEENERLTEQVAKYEEILNAATEIWFGYGRPAWAISKKNPSSKWESEDRHPLRSFGSALEAFQALKGDTNDAK